MKKTLLLASAALLLVGCAKEKFAEPIDGGLTNVTFTASLDSGVATKSADDGDGAAASVNRCIMEIYYGDALFTRQYAKVENKVATFRVQVVSNRKYKVAFWADCVDYVSDAPTEAELAIDKYYTTNATGGLQSISIKKITDEQLYIGNDDARDAFYHVGEYTVAQAGSSFGGGEQKILLKRPFAQMNVITTDWDKANKVTGLSPEKVEVTIKNALVNFNAVTGEASGSQTLKYEAAVYTPAAHGAEKTLSMDYLFAPKTDKAFIDIDWKALHGTDTDVAHAFAAVPYQRNYRTNIKGALLTTQGQWTVEVDPIWETDTNGDFDYAYTAVYDIQGANDFVAQNKDKREISVTFSTQPNDAGDPSQGTPDHPINAIVTSLLRQGATYNIDVASTTDVLYVGDYDYETTPAGTTYNYNHVLEETSEKTNAAAVNLVVTDNLYIGTLVVNSPSKSVSINGQTLESGHSYHIETLQVQEVSMNTVIIEKGMVVENLEMIKGGLEIHGTVNKATVPEGHGTIAVRDCENLNEELVYNVLKDHIAEGYVGVKGRTTEGLWDIVPAPFRVQKEGESALNYFYSIAEAITAVGDNGTATITVMADHNFSFSVATFATVKAGQTITLDLNGKKIVSGSTLGSGSQAIENKGTLTIVDTEGEGSWAHGASPSWIYDGSGSYVGSYVSNFITNRGTLYLNGGNLENLSSGSASYVADNFENSKITINGGNFNAASTAFRLFYGTVEMTVNGGIFTAGGYDIAQFTGNGSANNLIINGGEFTSDTDFNVYSWGETEGNHSTLKVTGGTFNQWVALSSKFNQIGNSVSGGKFYGAYNYGVGKFISGGVFEAEPDAQFVLDGYAVVANTDATTKAQYPWAVEALGQAKIGNVVYPTLEAAVAAAVEAGSGTIELLPAYIESGRYPQAWITSPCVVDDVPDGMSSTYTFHAFNPGNGDEEIYNKCTVDMSTQTINTDALDDNEKARVNAILAECNDYLNWPCDYEVFFDDADDANVSIKGNYAEFDWISCSIDQALSGGHQRLLLTMLGESLAAQFNYTAMLGFVNQFHCGLSNDEPAKNAGKTFSVELYMYHPEKENVKILISRTDYTFPQVN